MKVTINNFQSIGNAELEFDKGLIAITGPNSSGKSAIFRALRSVIENPPVAKHSVKKGTKRAEVTVSDLPGVPPVTWARTVSESSYKTSEGEFQRAGRNDVFDFLPAFPLRVDGDRLLNFQTEWDTLFPFERSSTELYALFEHIFSVVDSASIVGVIKGDEKNAKAQIELLTNELNAIVRRQQLTKEIITFDTSEDSIKSLATQLKDAIDYAEEIQAALAQVKQIDDLLSIDIPEEILLDPAPVEFAVSISSAYNEVKAIDSVLQLPLPSEISFSDEAFTTYFEISDALKQLDNIERVLSSVPPDLAEIDGSSLDIIPWALEIRSSLDEINRIDLLLQQDISLESMSLSSSLGLIDDTINSLLPFDKQFSDALLLAKSLDTEIASLDSTLEEVKAQLAEDQKKLSEIKVCPLCGQLINHE